MDYDLSPKVTHTVIVSFQKNCHILSIHFDDYRLFLNNYLLKALKAKGFQSKLS